MGTRYTIALIISVIFFLFSLWMFYKFSPVDEKRKKWIRVYNMMVLFTAVLFCVLYTNNTYIFLEAGEDLTVWTNLLILACLLISSVCLIAGILIRLLAFKKTYKDVKTFVLMLPVILSFILLAAHFLRDGNLLFAVSVLAVLFLILYYPGPEFAKVAQVVLVFGFIEWARSCYTLATSRLENHEPYIRLVIIMGGSACFTLFSALVFLTKSVKERYARHN